MLRQGASNFMAVNVNVIAASALSFCSAWVTVAAIAADARDRWFVGRTAHPTRQFVVPLTEAVVFL